MANVTDYLTWNVPIVDPKTGYPTPEFIRLIQARAVANNENVPGSRLINTTAPLTGGGDLTEDLTLGLAASGVTADTYGDSTHVAQVTVDTFGRITAATEVAISGGGGGGGLPPWIAPVVHVPQVSDFTVLNAGTAGTFTTTNQTFGIDFFATDDGGTEQVKALGMSLVDQTFTLAVRMYALMIPASYSVFGIGVRDSSTGQMVTMCLDCRGATVPRYRVTTRSSFTSAIANPIDLNAMHLCEYFRIVSDGTNRSWEISLDGRQWIPLGTTTIASYASGANQIFWWVSAADAANRPLRGSLVDWNYVP